MRARRMEHELHSLRPLGEAYVMRRFGGSLSRADAEDAVSEVVIRLHRRMSEGRAPENLRAAFFTSVRNAAIDHLRSRSVRPTVALEAAADAPTDMGIPSESAEERDDAVRLQEALGRMRENYREAIVLRFGLGLTVPEIARHLQISLPAAKKLVLRATRQVRLRLEAIEDAEFCPEMQELARQSLFEKHASGLASEAEAEVLRAHFAHCGSCRSFLASLHDGLHELGSVALLGFTASHQAPTLGLLDRVAGWVNGASDGVREGALKARHLAYRVGGVAQSGDGAASGAILGTGQKIVAVCTAGAAATATCVATGIVGPGIAPFPNSAHQSHTSPPAHVKHVSTPSSVPSSAPSAASVTPGPVATTSRTHETAKSTSTSASKSSVSKERAEARKTASASQAAQQPREFSFEGTGSPAPSSSTSIATHSATSSTYSAPPPTESSSTTSSGGSTSSGGGGGGGGGGEQFGFGG
jgi:RNA polymerase sigma factor (sigma-70 family)